MGSSSSGSSGSGRDWGSFRRTRGGCFWTGRLMISSYWRGYGVGVVESGLWNGERKKRWWWWWWWGGERMRVEEGMMRRERDRRREERW